MTNHSTLSSPHVERAAQHAYIVISKEKGINPDAVRNMRVCHQVADLMVENLVEIDPEVAKITREGWTVLSHSYVDLQPNGDRIADGTWQQFADEKRLTQDTPPVLIGSRQEVIDTLRSHGVDKITLDLWQKRD